MGQFFREALANQWVEAEDRAGKAPGGFTSMFPVSGEGRVFMTYGESMTGVLTLAHELGHAYHWELLCDLPAGARELPMTLAETASTLAEKLVESAAIERADGPEKLRLLDRRLSRASVFLNHTPAGFRLECAMHEARRDGTLRPDRLCEMTEEILQDAYGGDVASVDPFQWASTPHYYMTRYPFYNFPYSFGYLFSKALHERASEQGEAFAGTVDDLLADTGRATAEELARTHLDVDLTRPAFWRRAADSIRDDIEEFGRLVRYLHL